MRIQKKSLLKMKSTRPAFSVDVGKKKLVWKTSVLEPYMGGSMHQLQKGGSDEKSGIVYRVEKGSVTVIFKATVCSSGDDEIVRQIKEEFDLPTKAYQVARDGVVVPISYGETEDKDSREYTIETVYEYGGTDLLPVRIKMMGGNWFQKMGFECLRYG